MLNACTCQLIFIASYANHDTSSKCNFRSLNTESLDHFSAESMSMPNSKERVKLYNESFTHRYLSYLAAISAKESIFAMNYNQLRSVK